MASIQADKHRCSDLPPCVRNEYDWWRSARHPRGRTDLSGATAVSQNFGKAYSLRVLHTTVLNVSAAYAVSAGDIVDALKQLAELVIWGDVNDYDAIFE